jgi:ketosteroid isomerase-like protein
MKAYSLFLFLASFYLTACNQPSNSVATEKKDTVAAFDVSAVKSIIDENNKIFGDAVVKGDSAALVNLYATTAHMFPTNMPPIETYDGIKRFFGEFAKAGVKEFKLESVDVYGNGDNVIEEGKYTQGDGKGKIVDQGKYIVIWKQENGKWKLYRDIFNSNMPLPKSSK